MSISRRKPVTYDQGSDATVRPLQRSATLTRSESEDWGRPPVMGASTESNRVRLSDLKRNTSFLGSWTGKTSPNKKESEPRSLMPPALAPRVSHAESPSSMSMARTDMSQQIEQLTEERDAARKQVEALKAQLEQVQSESAKKLAELHDKFRKLAEGLPSAEKSAEVNTKSLEPIQRNLTDGFQQITAKTREIMERLGMALETPAVAPAAEPVSPLLTVAEPVDMPPSTGIPVAPPADTPPPIAKEPLQDSKPEPRVDHHESKPQEPLNPSKDVPEIAALIESVEPQAAPVETVEETTLSTPIKVDLPTVPVLDKALASDLLSIMSDFGF